MLGRYLKKYRLSHNLSQKEMAERLGTSQGYYCLIENNKTKPGLQLIKRISELLDKDPSFIRELL